MQGWGGQPFRRWQRCWRQAEGRNRQRSECTWAKDSSLSPTTSWRGHWPAQPSSWACAYLGVWSTFIFSSPFTFAIWRRWRDLIFFFNLRILAVILGGPHVPSTPRWCYKIGSSGFGEARVWLRRGALFWKRIEIFVFFWDRRSQSRGHSFTTWYNSLPDSAWFYSLQKKSIWWKPVPLGLVLPEVDSESRIQVQAIYWGKAHRWHQ